jgi:DnaJ-class molecular chaperone
MDDLTLGDLLDIYNTVPLRVCPACLGTGCRTQRFGPIAMIDGTKPCSQCNGAGQLSRVFCYN